MTPFHDTVPRFFHPPPHRSLRTAASTPQPPHRIRQTDAAKPNPNAFVRRKRLAWHPEAAAAMVASDIFFILKNDHRLQKNIYVNFIFKAIVFKKN